MHLPGNEALDSQSAKTAKPVPSTPGPCGLYDFAGFGLLPGPVVGGVAAPHEPTVILRVARVQAIQGAGTGRDVHLPPGHRRLEHDRLADAGAPEQLARF